VRHVFVSPVSTFQSFLFSALSRRFAFFAGQNVLVDPGLSFPIFHFSYPVLVDFCVSRVFRGHALVGFCAFCAFCGWFEISGSLGTFASLRALRG
jgi:hypothetical protein